MLVKQRGPNELKDRSIFVLVVVQLELGVGNCRCIFVLVVMDVGVQQLGIRIVDGFLGEVRREFLLGMEVPKIKTIFCKFLNLFKFCLNLRVGKDKLGLCRLLQHLSVMEQIVSFLWNTKIKKKELYFDFKNIVE